jgi:hypothetical protein
VPHRAKPLSDRHRTLAVVKVIERRDRSQPAVHGRRLTSRIAARQHDHVLRRTAQPAREIPELLEPQIRPVIAAQLKELPELAQIACLRADRVRRTLGVRQPSQERLDRLHQSPIRPDHRPGLNAALNNALDPAAPLRRS